MWTACFEKKDDGAGLIILQRQDRSGRRIHYADLTAVEVREEQWLVDALLIEALELAECMTLSGAVR